MKEATVTVMAAPRIQVVLTSVEDADPNAPDARFDLWVVLQVPDGQDDPTTVCLAEGITRDDASLDMNRIWTAIGEGKWKTDPVVFPPVH